VSRGHGAIQRFILDTVEEGQFWPVSALAGYYASQHDGSRSDATTLRRSFRRAARALVAAGELDAYTANVPTQRLAEDELYEPTGSRRRVAVVARPGSKPAAVDDDLTLRQAMYGIASRA
jgi:hypothetical protein